MIASLRGKVAHIGLDSVVLDVQGVGYRVFATPETLATLRLEAGADLATSLVVREDAMTLYGFASTDERDTFETLQTVSGVGPKLALAMLAVHTPEELRRAVDGEDLKMLQRVPGVGPKSAKRLVLELTGKLGAPLSPAPAAPSGGGEVGGDVLEALIGLGWNGKAAKSAVDGVLARPNPPAASAEILRQALLELGGKNRG